MSTVITIAICAVLVATLTFALVKGVWAASKKITVPFQIVLFVVILACVGRMLFTKENAKKLYDGIDRSGVSQNMENTVRSALNMKSVAKSEPVSASAPTADGRVEPAPASAAKLPPSESVAKASVPESTVPESPVSETVNAAAPAAVPEPKPVAEVTPDYSRFDKGKKTFSYALPFGAQLTVGFRDGTYRIIAESLGTLDSSEKKEIGKMVMNALSEYSGEKVAGLDKSKVSIEVKYDDEANRTRVFVTVPPSAIE